jgi:hypothetical protein
LGACCWMLVDVLRLTDVAVEVLPDGLQGDRLA